MSLTSILNKLFGNKSQRDLKEIQPIVDQINALGPKMKGLSNDELRDIITNIKKELQNAVADDTKAITELKEKLTNFLSMNVSLFGMILMLEKRISLKYMKRNSIECFPMYLLQCVRLPLVSLQMKLWK